MRLRAAHPHGRRKLGVLIGQALFAAWLGAVFFVVTGLAGAHWYALPPPQLESPRLRAVLTQHAAGAGRRAWSVSHVLYGRCACSLRVIEHLHARGALSEVVEQVILAGPRPGQETTLRAGGFAVHAVEPEELRTRYGLEGAPLMIVAEPSGAVRYLGGYSERKQGPVIRDREILAALMRGDERGALPLFGCAVSRSLQRLLDPLGLRYAKD